MGYNGWTNYETWVCNLWLDNDGSSDYISDLAISAMIEHENDRDLAIYHLSDQIGDMICNAQPDLGNNMFADMLSASIREIDFREIAEHYISETDDQDLN